MSVTYFNAQKDEPLSIVALNAIEIDDNSNTYIQFKLTNEGLIIDFYKDGEIAGTMARTFEELWEECPC